MPKPPEFSMFMTTRGLHLMPMNHSAIFMLSLFDADGNGIMDFDQATALLYDENRELN